MSRQKDILQGTLTLLVLKTLAARGALHGYGIVTHIQQVSGEALRVEEGSLYPALHRLENDGWIQAEWRMTELGRRARFYQLTAAGREALEQEQRQWADLTQGVARVLNFA